MKIEYYTVVLFSYEYECKESHIDKINFTTEEEAERYIDIHKQELFRTYDNGYAGNYARVIKRVLNIEEKAE